MRRFLAWLALLRAARTRTLLASARVSRRSSGFRGFLAPLPPVAEAVSEESR